MNEDGKSDGSEVPAKPANNGRDASRSAEQVEGRGPTKGNSVEQTRFRTQRRGDLPPALDRVRQAAMRERTGRLTALWHHVYDKDQLRQAFRDLNRKPETFDFLGLTHICGQDRRGRFAVLRKTKRRRVRDKLRELKQELRRRLHHPVPDVGKWLATVLLGHYRYFGVPWNYRSLAAMRRWVVRLWYRALRRRSQRHRITWPRMTRLEQRWLPQPKIYHPHPQQRLRV